MRRIVLMAVVFGIGVAVAGTTGDPPPVMLDLGPMVPTPAPTPDKSNRLRLITTITVQNVAGGDSAISFEAMDVADQGKGKFNTVAAARYSLSEDMPKLQALRSKIFRQIRDLERDLLEYAKIAGPPKERRPLMGDSQDEAGDSGEADDSGGDE
ncbi:MAG: hypothetical protein HY699_24295 [Deltaproteobacteria bacterium]|nr:hypothetical protein [Deltaproteobacteria bacterium]